MKPKYCQWCGRKLPCRFHMQGVKKNMKSPSPPESVEAALKQHPYLDKEPMCSCETDYCTGNCPEALSWNTTTGMTLLARD